MTAGELRTRLATRQDAEAIARIYNDGIEERVATFETDARAAVDVLSWLEEAFPLVVVEYDGEVTAWASAPPYQARPAYAGVANSRSTSRGTIAAGDTGERR